MIDKLESQIESSLRTTASGRETESSSTAEEVTKLKVSLDRMNKAYEEMEEKRDALQAEMDRRALRGDYNPNETRILHFRYNNVFWATEWA